MEERVVLVDENDNEIDTMAKVETSQTKNKKNFHIYMDLLVFPHRFLNQ